jgi:hypothetical protein
MTRPLSPLVLAAPLAAAVLLAATGWATGAGTPATASPAPPNGTVGRPASDPALRALRHAVAAERHDIRRLERTLAQARDDLHRARAAAATSWAASAPSAPSTSAATGAGSSGSSGLGSGGSGSSGSGSGPAPAPPPADTTTGGS